MAFLLRGGAGLIDDGTVHSPLTCHVLVARAAQHGVHRMSHLVEEVLHHAGGQQGGGALGGRGQAKHQHHHRQLVLTALLALPAATDGEVAVLSESDVDSQHFPRK